MTKIETLKKQLQERQKIIRNKIDLYNNQKEKIINDLRALNFYSDYEIQENEKVKDLSFSIDNLTSKNNEILHTLIMIELL